MNCMTNANCIVPYNQEVFSARAARLGDVMSAIVISINLN